MRLPCMGSKERKERKEQEQVNKNRRRFLKIGLAGIVAASASAAYFVYGAPRKEDKWDFLRDPDTDQYRKLPEKEILTKWKPLINEIILSNDTREYRDFIAKIQPEIEQFLARAGKTGQFDATATQQKYGLPCALQTAEHFKSYCEIALKFLAENLRGLKHTDLQFHALGTKPVANGNAYLLKTMCDLYRAYIKKDGTPQLTASQITFNNGGYSYNEVIGEQHNWRVFLGEGKFSINSIFSEVIPLTTIPVSLKTFRNSTDLYQAEEALSESISHNLGLKVARELSIPNGERIIMRGLEELTDSRYDAVPRAITWVEKNGIQQAFDLYMEDPRKFMEAIKK